MNWSRDGGILFVSRPVIAFVEGGRAVAKRQQLTCPSTPLRAFAKILCSSREKERQLANIYKPVHNYQYFALQFLIISILKELKTLS